MKLQYKTTQYTESVFNELEENIEAYEDTDDVKALECHNDLVMWEAEYFFRLGELLWDAHQYETLGRLSDFAGTSMFLPVLNNMMGTPEILSVEELLQVPSCVRDYLGSYWLKDAGTAPDSAAIAECNRAIFTGTAQEDIYMKLLIRPVIHVPNIDLLLRHMHKTLIYIGGRRWDAIGDDRLIWSDMLYPVYHKFDSKTNDYNASSLKKYVEGGKFMRRVTDQWEGLLSITI